MKFANGGLVGPKQINMSKIFTWSKYKFWHLKIGHPYDYDDEDSVNLKIGIYKLYIDIPLYKTGKRESNFGNDSLQYGITYHDDTFWLYTGEGNKSFDAPWQWTIVRHDLLNLDGSLYYRNSYKNGRRSPDHLYFHELENTKSYVSAWTLTETMNITHTTSHGDTQETVVTLHGEEREWRWKWLQWLPFNKLIHRVCDFEFSSELGDRAGSWKGGLTATSTEWKSSETLKESFTRWYKNWDGR